MNVLHHFSSLGTSVIQVTATDADDPTYGNSARVVYSILQGQPYFSVDSKTGIFHTISLCNCCLRQTQLSFSRTLQGVY
jgi:hypothetical protein